MRSRNYFENENKISNGYMKMELGIKIKLIFGMEIVWVGVIMQ